MTKTPLTEGQQVRVTTRAMPGVAAGTIGTVRHASPSGRTNPGLIWLDLGKPYMRFRGVSEPGGCWVSPSEVEPLP